MNAKKIAAIVLAVVLVFGCGVGATLAWLVDNTAEVKNTFTVGNIDITLVEENPADPTDIKMVPGATIEKDPIVTVVDGSESCWLFVKVTAENGVALEGKSTASDYVTYAIADGWTLVDEAENVYGRKVEANAAEKAFSVLKDDQVKVLSTVTKSMMEAIENGTAAEPTLSFIAYAIQSDNLTKADGTAVTSEAEAWAVYEANP